MKTAIIAGVGPLEGLGAQLCMRFAMHDLHVVVAGRTREKLDHVVSEIEKSGGQASAIVCDCVDETAIAESFRQVSTIGDLDLAIYNVGNNFPGTILEMEAEYFENAWRSVCFGGFLFSREAYRNMSERQRGTILFTGASASLRGKANYGAFNSSKAALRTFAQALAKEAGPSGIHIGHVIVDGAINGDKIKSAAPGYAASLGAEGMISIDGIVDAYEYLYRQEKTAWTFELDLRTAIENW